MGRSRRLKKIPPTNLRQAVLVRLAELDRSPNWLAVRQRRVTPNTVRTWLYGDGVETVDVKASTVEACLDVLGLVFTSASGYDLDKTDQMTTKE